MLFSDGGKQSVSDMLWVAQEEAIKRIQFRFSVDGVWMGADGCVFTVFNEIIPNGTMMLQKFVSLLLSFNSFSNFSVYLIRKTIMGWIENQFLKSTQKVFKPPTSWELSSIKWKGRTLMEGCRVLEKLWSKTLQI